MRVGKQKTCNVTPVIYEWKKKNLDMAGWQKTFVWSERHTSKWMLCIFVQKGKGKPILPWAVYENIENIEKADIHYPVVKEPRVSKHLMVAIILNPVINPRRPI